MERKNLVAGMIIFRFQEINKDGGAGFIMRAKQGAGLEMDFA